MNNQRRFSLYDVEQFIREAGAERVTEDAVLDLERELEKLAEKMTNKAVRYAAHAGRRKLIKREDILLLRSGSKKAYIGSSAFQRKPRSFRAKAKITNASPIPQMQ